MTIAERIQEAKVQDLLTVDQCALLTQMHPKSIYRLIERNAIVYVRIGRSVRIPRVALRGIRPVPTT